MNRSKALALGTSVAVALGLSVAATGTAEAAYKIPHPKIKTYVEVDNTKVTGIGRAKGWYYHQKLTNKATLSPAAMWEHGTYNGTDSGSSYWQGGVVSRTVYDSEDGKAYKVTPMTAKQYTTWLSTLNPNHITKYMLKLKHVRRVSKHHYVVTGTPSQLSSLINHELNFNTKYFKRNGFKKLTINLYLGGSNRPTKLTTTGTGKYEKANLTETFGSYNKALTITAPKV